MSAALAQKIADTENSAIAASAQIIDFEQPDTAAQKASDGAVIPQDIIAEAKAGMEQLMRMSPDELNALIARRVQMLETELTDREARRSAIAEATAAQRILESHRSSARSIRHKVNIGSSLVVAMFTGLIIANIF
jgi:hypothetical protein